MTDVLKIDLIVDETGAARVLGGFEGKLKKTESEINSLGKRTTFAKDFSDKLSEVEGRVSKFNQNLNGAFNLVIFGAAGKVFTDLTQKAFEAERANRQLSASATQAGLAYQFLAEKSKEFANEGGLSEVAANRTEGLIAKLAQAAGRPQDLDKLETALLDTASARGLQVSQLETLVNAVISGSSDEPLNAVGLSDPGKLAKDYADKLGKSTEALTKQEQVLSRLLPLMQQAETVTGANAERMQSLSGQAETASARIEDLQTNLGKGVTNTLEFRDALKLANDVLGSMTANISEVQKKLSEGFTPRQIAEQEAGKTGSQVLDFTKTALTFPLANLAYVYDAATEGFETANNRYIETLTGAKDRRIEALTGLIEGEKKLLDKQNKAAEKQKTFLNSQSFADQEKARAEAEKENLKNRRKAFDSRFSNLGGLNDINQNRQLLNELKQNQDLFTPEEYTKKLYDAQQKINEEIEKGKKKIKELGKTYEETFDNIFARSQKENPFVQVFSEGDKALKTLRENIKGLPLEMQKAAIAMQEKINSGALFGAKIDNNLDVFDLQERAKSMRNPQESGEQRQKRIDDVVQASIKSGGYFQGIGGSLGSYLANQAGGFDNLTDAQRRNIYEARSFGSITAVNPSGSTFNDLNQNSLQTALANDRLRDADKNLSINDRLRKQIGIIDSGASTAEEKALADKKLISLSSGLNPSDVSSELRSRLAVANENEAARRANYEKESLQVQKDTLKTNAQIAENGKKLLAVAEKEGLAGVNKAVEILITNKSGGAADVKKDTGKSADNKSVRSYYEQYEDQ